MKNIATYEKYHGHGYGKKLVDYICEYYKNDCDIMYVGTGDSPLTIPYYKKCEFSESHRVKIKNIKNSKELILYWLELIRQ